MSTLTLLRPATASASPTEAARNDVLLPHLRQRRREPPPRRASCTPRPTGRARGHCDRDVGDRDHAQLGGNHGHQLSCAGVARRRQLRACLATASRTPTRPVRRHRAEYRVTANERRSGRSATSCQRPRRLRPAGMTATAVSTSQINLTWTPETDATDISSSARRRSTWATLRQSG